MVGYHVLGKGEMVCDNQPFAPGSEDIQSRQGLASGSASSYLKGRKDPARLPCSLQSQSIAHQQVKL
ncbi:hypothetical protein Arad_3823 [Rhizobium rhizogenes K84]|uniref:Uncharacterized protein n=1 Tax=Rhizobium rhizogenes (strain K84 / ATCC BAA-868) TaxID=311403 RepID=B9JA66_RHIR8|nr:hypothetical protein Arad_3823 [Rhizobium rhizogenes K84]